jgi:23S rRNA G2069 N7-methylase RlmK/C1962 C5-methylase RlmI
MREVEPGQRVLNLFSYTGSFGLAALAGEHATDGDASATPVQPPLL